MSDYSPEASRQMDQLLENSTSEGNAIDFEQITLGQKAWSPEVVIENTEGLLSGNRKRRIEEVLKGRTFTVTPVIEGLVNTGNVSAVIRTSEAMGFQPFHFINNGGKFKQSERISHGAEKWLSVWQWEDPISCARFLKAHGYRVVATTLDKQAKTLSSVDFTQPIALVFGNEAGGVTNEMLKASDQTCYIPLTGFTQSLNISVAAAVSLSHAYEQRLRKQGYHGDLSPDQMKYLRALFYFKSVNKGEEVLKKMG